MNRQKQFDVATLLALGLQLKSSGRTFHPGLLAAEDARFSVSHQSDLGGMCEVWLGFDKGTGRQVAIKVARTDRLSEEQAETLFLNEKQVLKELEGIPGYELISSGGQGHSSYLVMPFIEGETVERFLHDANVQQQRALVRAMIMKLARIHEAGVVHGDLKPNHFICLDGDICVLDFGVSRLLRNSKQLHHKQIAGSTPEYSPPELLEALDLESLEPSIDIYGFGRILQQQVEQFKGSTKGVIRYMIRLILEAELKDRPAHGKALLELFDSWWLKRSRLKMGAISIGAVTIALMGMTTFGYTQFSSNGSPTQVQTDMSASVPITAHWISAYEELDKDVKKQNVIHRITNNGPAIDYAYDHVKQISAWRMSDGTIEIFEKPNSFTKIAVPLEIEFSEMAWSDDGVLGIATRAGDLWVYEKVNFKKIARGFPQTYRLQWTKGEWVAWSKSEQSLYTFGYGNAAPIKLLTHVDARPLSNSSGGWLAVPFGQNLNARATLFGCSDRVREREWSLPALDRPRAATYIPETHQIAVTQRDRNLLLIKPERLEKEFNIHFTATAVTSVPGTDLYLAGASEIMLISSHQQAILDSRETIIKGLIYAMFYDPSNGTLSIITCFGWEEWKITQGAEALALH